MSVWAFKIYYNCEKKRLLFYVGYIGALDQGLGVVDFNFNLLCKAHSDVSDLTFNDAS
jgi:hypothetical protein